MVTETYKPDFSLVMLGADTDAEKRRENREMVQTGERWRAHPGRSEQSGRHNIVDIVEEEPPAGEVTMTEVKYVDADTTKVLVTKKTVSTVHEKIAQEIPIKKEAEKMANKVRRIAIHREYEVRREEILAVLVKTRRAWKEASRQLDVPVSTLKGLWIRWSEPKVQEPPNYPAACIFCPHCGNHLSIAHVEGAIKLTVDVECS